MRACAANESPWQSLRPRIRGAISGEPNSDAGGSSERPRLKSAITYAQVGSSNSECRCAASKQQTDDAQLSFSETQKTK